MPCTHGLASSYWLHGQVITIGAIGVLN